MWWLLWEGWGATVAGLLLLQAVPASPGKKSALSMLCDLLSNLFDSSQ